MTKKINNKNENKINKEDEVEEISKEEEYKLKTTKNTETIMSEANKILNKKERKLLNNRC